MQLRCARCGRPIENGTTGKLTMFCEMCAHAEAQGRVQERGPRPAINQISLGDAMHMESLRKVPRKSRVAPARSAYPSLRERH